MSEDFEGVELVPVREAHRFDEAALRHYLADNLEGFSGPLEVVQFEGGQSNPTFQLITAAQFKSSDYLKMLSELLPNVQSPTSKAGAFFTQILSGNCPINATPPRTSCERN